MEFPEVMSLRRDFPCEIGLIWPQDRLPATHTLSYLFSICLPLGIWQVVGFL